MEYPNLRAEMARFSIRAKDISKLLGVSNTTARKKMGDNNNCFNLNEAFLIRDTFFQGMSLDYLFNKNIHQKNEFVLPELDKAMDEINKKRQLELVKPKKPTHF